MERLVDIFRRATTSTSAAKNPLTAGAAERREWHYEDAADASPQTSVRLDGTSARAAVVVAVCLIVFFFVYLLLLQSTIVLLLWFLWFVREHGLGFGGELRMIFYCENHQQHTGPVFFFFQRPSSPSAFFLAIERGERTYDEIRGNPLLLHLFRVTPIG